jgi:hypothetical protein
MMSEPTLEQLASRIAQLEQRLRSGGLVLLAVIALQLWQAWAADTGGHKNVEPESFALRGSDGKIRAQLSVSPDGMPILGMRDAADKIRAMLSLGADGTPSLRMNDADGTPRVLLSVLPNGTPSLGLYDAGNEGTPRVFLSVLPDGTPSLGLYDAGKKLRAMLSTDPSGTPALSLYDAEQNLRAKFDHYPRRDGGDPGPACAQSGMKCVGGKVSSFERRAGGDD